jgi:hypothetical protein
MVDKTRLAKMQKMRGHTKTECKSKGTSMTKDEALKLALEALKNADEREIYVMEKDRRRGLGNLFLDPKIVVAVCFFLLTCALEYT